ncbi:MAG: endonuclease [Bacteroidota bacterium]
MNKILTSILLISVMPLFLIGQETGYYNNTSGLTGEALKSQLNDIIQDHQSMSYYTSKTVFKNSDADPENPENIILVYTGRSHDNDDYGTGGDYVNREHVWAKSHGDFGNEPPEGSDFHNLKPADASVNMDRSNKDFDYSDNEHDEAEGNFYDSDSWEPRDEVKGDIARIIFYMATRYEGENGEEDLKVVDEVNTYPAAEHGKLSTLLEWNMMDPPDDFERNRNNVIFSWQRNRNPFIDNPEFAERIWNNQEASPVIIDEITISDDIDAENPVEITANITSEEGNISNATIKWGTNPDNLNNEVSMSASGDLYTGNIPAQPEESNIYYAVEAADGSNTGQSVTYTYYVPPTFNGELVTIYDLQGQSEHSPMADQIEDNSGVEELNYGEVSTSGVVTAYFGDKYFIQDGKGAWNGVMVYDQEYSPQIGDSIIVTGLVKEYYNMTEIIELSGYYHIASGKELPEPVEINTGDAAEEYESVLVKVTEAVCTDDDYFNNYYMWEVDDGSGELFIHNTDMYTFEPNEGNEYTIQGPLNWDFGEWKVELRFEEDVQGFADTEAPELNEVNILEEDKIEVFFNEDVDKSSAENDRNYTINNEIEVESANRHLINHKKVTLNVTPLSEGESYTLTIKNVADDNGNSIDELTYEFGYQVSIEEIVEGAAFRVYPNPARENINLDFKAKKPTELRLSVLTTDGRTLVDNDRKVLKGNNHFSIPVSELSPGIYILSLEFPEGRKLLKIVKK